MSTITLKITINSEGSVHPCHLGLDAAIEDPSLTYIKKATIVSDFVTACRRDSTLTDILAEYHKDQTKTAHEQAVVYLARKHAEEAAKSHLHSAWTIVSGPNPSGNFKSVDDDELLSVIPGV